MARNDNGRSFTMMKTAGKYARKILSIALICILALSFSVQAFAAGEETWGYTTQLVPVGYFNFKNTNLTPVKTIDYTGLLTIDISFFQRTDSSSSPVKLTVQVRKAGTSTVLAEDVFYETIGDGGAFSLQVQKGDRIQIFFDASTVEGYTKPGYTRSACVKYVYVLS